MKFMVMKKKLVIDLKSDLISGSGTGWSNIVDNDITYDQYGFPYIPAKRIKGLLKEAAYELEQFNYFKKGKSEELFGNDDKQGHHFILYNATLENITEMQHEILNLKNEYHKYVHPIAVLNHYTNIRYQTAIDDKGIAKENTLRSSRAVAKGFKFYAKMEYDQNDEKDIEDCINMIHHMGINRTRGFGEVDLSIIDDKSTDNKFELKMVDEQEYEVKLYLENLTQLSMISTKGEKSLDYIPGSAILGYFANRYLKTNDADDTFNHLFILGDVKFSNAYISDYEWNEYYPIKESIYKEKTGDNYYDKTVNSPNGIILSKVHDKFMTSDGKIKSVEKEMYYHHRRPTDKSIGHVVSNALQDQGIFYQLEVISANQRFIAKIKGKGVDLKKVLKDLPSYIQIGKSKYTQYGNIHIANAKVEQINNNIIKENTEVVCTLHSPLLLFNDKKESDLNLANLAAKLNIENPEYFIGYSQVGGYNAKWKLQKPSYIAFKAGSCIKGTLTMDSPNKLIIGSLNQEGLGEVVIEKLDDIKNITISKSDNKVKGANEEPNYTKEIIIDSIKHHLLINSLKEMNNKPISISKTAIGRVLAMLNNPTWDLFIKDVNGIADEDKRKEIITVIEAITNMCDRLITESNITNLSDKDYHHEFYLKTCKNYFTQQKIERREA